LAHFKPINQECFIVKNLDFDWQIHEFMLYCRTTQLREKSMKNTRPRSTQAGMYS